MSESIFASLPRFDEDGAHPTVTLRGGEPAPEPAEPEIPAGPSEAELELERTTQALKDTIAALSALQARLQEESARKTKDQILALATTLFPKLGEAFLADEIMRHLPTLVPATAASVEIRAEPAVASRIESILASGTAIKTRIEVTEDDSPGPNRASVAWKDGGVDFDFAGLLESCLAQLKAA